jgi:hypothetical protein
VTHYFLALATTIIVEALVLAALTRGPERRRVVTACVFVNCLTHPIAWVLNLGGLPIFGAVELAVVAAEAQLYSTVVPARYGRALVWSLAANGVTIALSFWI